MVHVRIGSKPGKSHSEQMFSGVPRIADIAQRGWHGREVPTAAIAANRLTGRYGTSLRFDICFANCTAEFLI